MMAARIAACVQRYGAAVLSSAVRSCLLIGVTTAILPAEVLTRAGAVKVLAPGPSQTDLGSQRHCRCKLPENYMMR